MTSRLLLILALFFLPSAASAYIGPGAALGLAGYFFGMMGAVGVAALMVLYLPVHIVLKKRKARKRAAATASSETPPASPTA